MQMRSKAILVLLLIIGCADAPMRGDLLGDPFTIVGIPRVLSDKTFMNIDGEERGLLVDVLKVTDGRYEKNKIEFPIPINQTSPLKIGVKYSITAGYGRHGVVILDYYEIK
jgi:hypothetical protein